MQLLTLFVCWFIVCADSCGSFGFRFAAGCYGSVIRVLFFGPQLNLRCPDVMRQLVTAVGLCVVVRFTPRSSLNYVVSQQTLALRRMILRALWVFCASVGSHSDM